MIYIEPVQILNIMHLHYFEYFKFKVSFTLVCRLEIRLRTGIVIRVFLQIPKKQFFCFFFIRQTAGSDFPNKNMH